MEALNGSVAVLGLVRPGDRSIPLPLSIVVGAFATRDSSEMWLMGYCPILGMNARESAEKVVTRSRNLLFERMIGLFTRVEDVARNLWMPQSKDLCSKHIPWGTVANLL